METPVILSGLTATYDPTTRQIQVAGIADAKRVQSIELLLKPSSSTPARTVATAFRPFRKAGTAVYTGGQPADLSDYARLDGALFVGPPQSNITVDISDPTQVKQLVRAKDVRDYYATQNNLAPFNTARVSCVRGYGQSTPGQHGSQNVPYRSIQEWHDDVLTVDGDVALYYAGGTGTEPTTGRACYLEAYLQQKNVTVIGVGRPIHAGQFTFGNYGASKPFRYSVYGIVLASRALTSRQAGGASYSLFADCEFIGQLGGLQTYQNSPGALNYTDEVVLRDCTVNSERDGVTTTGVGYDLMGPIRIEGRGQFGPVNVILENTSVTTKGAAAVTVRTTPGNAKLTLLRATSLRPKTPGLEIETLDNTEGFGPAPLAGIVRDYRFDVQTDPATGNRYRFGVNNGAVVANPVIG